MESSKKTLDTRLPSLDGWRAIAVLLVLFSHVPFTYHVPAILSHLSVVTAHGVLGVRMFFVISGFIISLLLLKEAHAKGTISLKKFYTRRVYRIFPVYFAYLLVLWILMLAGLYSDAPTSWLGCLTFTRNIVGRGNSATTHFWSLAIEEQFYFTWPIIFKLFQLWRRPFIYIGVLIIPIVMAPVFRDFWATDGFGHTFWNKALGSRSVFVYADSISTGCLGALIFWRFPPSSKWVGCQTIILATSLLVLFGSDVLSLRGFAVIPTIQAWAMLSCVLLSINVGSFVYVFLNSRLMIALGMLSYSIYVWHFLFLSDFMGPHFNGWYTHDWKTWLLAAMAVSTVSYYYLEMPLLDLRRKLHG